MNELKPPPKELIVSHGANPDVHLRVLVMAPAPDRFHGAPAVMQRVGDATGWLAGELTIMPLHGRNETVALAVNGYPDKGEAYRYAERIGHR